MSVFHQQLYSGTVETTENDDSTYKINPPHEVENDDDDSNENDGPQEEAPIRRQSKRIRKPLLRLTYENALTGGKKLDINEMFVTQEPSSYEETVQAKNSGKWQPVMVEEIEALRGHKTWTIVDPSAVKQNFIDCKWVYKVKHETRATKGPYKARLVAKGCQQRRGIDFNETYAPVTKMSTIRLVLAHAHTRRHVLNQVEVKDAFVNGILEEIIYVRQPEGFVDNRHPCYICKMLKALYGLK